MDQIINITHREGLGRTGTWTIARNSLNLPLIGNIISPRLPITSKPELVITEISGSEIPEAKLTIYHQENPLLSGELPSEMVDITHGSLAQPNLIVPGTICYPEYFNELGVPPDTLCPPKQKNCTDTLESEYIQIITSATDQLMPGPRLVIISNALKLVTNPRTLLKRVLSLNHRNDPNKLLYLPGIAAPNNLAILAYLGVDIIDTCQCILQARAGNLMTNNGLVPNSAIYHDICTCDGCQELRNGGKSFENILKHNIHTLTSELNFVKLSINRGKLRDLVETRMLTEPNLSALIRLMDLEYYKTIEPYFPVYRPGQFITCSREALNRVEVIRFRDRIKERYKRPKSARILILLPCSARKPYSTSKSHKLFRRAIQSALQNTPNQSLVHEVIITSPLGLIPRELELVYPAQQYDIPVTGHWFEDELQMIKFAFNEYFFKNNYDHILIHFDRPMAKFIEDCIRSTHNNTTQTRGDLPDGPQTQIIHSCLDKPTTKQSLEKLEKELSTLANQYSNESKSSNQEMQLETLTSISQYQFGPPGIKLVRNCKIKGRYPYLKLFQDRTQVGMLTGDRGMISLTLPGAQMLADSPGFEGRAAIEDFVPSGSVMAVGVIEANTKIRVGDEVIASYKNELRAVGQAAMNGTEMVNSTRGVAIKVRHHVKE